MEEKATGHTDEREVKGRECSREKKYVQGSVVAAAAASSTTGTAGGPLCRGRLRPLVVADGVYHVAYEREQEIVKCPWHQWEFDVKTGTAICDPRLRVKTYRVAEENGELVVYW